MEFKKEDLFTIPNILTYIRLVCIPVFVALMAMYFVTKHGAYRWASFGVFLFAEITDICDGYIARHYNQVTDIGKVLDPIADKVLQCVAILMLCICQNIHWAFAIVIIVKEVYMGVSSKYFMRASKRQVEQKSVKIGKAGAVIYFVGILMSFAISGDENLEGWRLTLNEIIKWTDFAILIIASVLAIVAAGVYTKIYCKKLKEVRASGILDTLDRYGRPLPVVEERKSQEEPTQEEAQSEEQESKEEN